MYNLQYEKDLLKNYKTVGGIDEAGRGPLAGPVVAACVAFDKNYKIYNKQLEQVSDSKKLSPAKREELYKLIISEIPNIGIGVCDSQTVDRINVLQATFLAMKKAVGGLRLKPEFLVIDGNKILPNISIKQTYEIKGDARVFMIAAASIVAKVTRDRMMLRFHQKYPRYGFDKHKGYGTELHMQMLQKHGPCEIHRTSYAPVTKCISTAL